MRPVAARWSAVRGALLLLTLLTTVSAASAPLPAGWPNQFMLGLGDGPGSAAALKACAPFGLRYQYLSGGVNTGGNWSTWNTPSGAFASLYIDDSLAQDIVPMFVYYTLVQSNPSAGNESQNLTRLNTTATMQAWYADFKLLMQKSGAYPGKLVVVNVEPDLWGYIQQGGAGDPTAVAVKVGACGGDVSGFANNASGFAQAIVHLRDLYAPNVAIGFHASIWGTNWDLLTSTPIADDAKATALGVTSGQFFNALGADFDLLFGEFADRDADFSRIIVGDLNRWYEANDYRRHRLFMASLSATANRRIVLWQIPYGNTRMRTCDNTWGHYQSNQVEWLLGDDGFANVAAYRDAGVVALAFGGGAGGVCFAADANSNGVTNPAAFSNTFNGTGVTNEVQAVLASAGTAPVYNAGAKTLTTPYAADDDGGYCRWRCWRYYQVGAISIPTDGGTTGGGGGGGGGSTGGGGGGGGCGVGGGAATMFGLLWLVSVRLVPLRRRRRG